MPTSPLGPRALAVEPRATPSSAPGLRADVQALPVTRGAVLWLTGLSGSGKTTLAAGVRGIGAARGWHVVVLDGDRFRAGVSADLGFSAADRLENIRRAAEVAALLAEAGTIVVAAFISPTHDVRARARQIVERAGVAFAEIHLSASLEVCEARDVKRLYARARAGLLAGLTGVSAPFEPPVAPDLRIDTGVVSYDAALSQLVAALESLACAGPSSSPPPQPAS
jgi:adenylyl-sulfate kinase